MVDLLATRDGSDVSYRDLYNIVHGPGFSAGFGNEGYRSNVHAFIKRIRRKFRDLDGAFDEIEAHSGFGYRWREPEALEERSLAASLESASVLTAGGEARDAETGASFRPT